MGYYNPILQMDLKTFLAKANNSGVDGVLIVDMPPESNELLLVLKKSTIDFIRLASPTTNKGRNDILKKLLLVFVLCIYNWYYRI